MRRIFFGVTLLVLTAGAFIAGSWLTFRRSGTATDGRGRKILHYVDPMNPAHTSDRPGIAPCGMPMEPVYADDPTGGSSGRVSVPPGSVSLSPERQQLFGVRSVPVEKKALQQTLRLLGKVAVDETRSFQITAPSEGWVTKAMPVTVGSFVTRDQTLAMFYSPTFISAGQAFRNALEYQDRMKANPEERAVQRTGLAEFNVQQYRESLRNLGVSDRQIDDMIRTRQFSQHIEIVAPADGLIIARNVSQGQRFEKGLELYRVVDLSRVWILVDAFDNEERQLKPGSAVRVTMAKRGISLNVRVSETLPQFDPISRSLKVRLEADNPGFRLRPEMFVDVELPVNLPDSLTVPAGAVIDMGLRKTVFVDRGDGHFEPRRVETGWRFGDRVEITKGLMEGERIVVSGNFLVDSESRMRLAAAGLPEDYVLDPVCGMGVDPRKASVVKLEYQGQAYYFCNPSCKESFLKNPSKYLVKDSQF